MGWVVYEGSRGPDDVDGSDDFLREADRVKPEDFLSPVAGLLAVAQKRRAGMSEEEIEAWLAEFRKRGTRPSGS